MDKTYDSIKEMLEANLKKIEKKGDISKEDLCAVKEATEAIYYIEGIKNKGAMMNPGYSEGIPYSHAAPMPDLHSYGPNRSPVTGRYISRGAGDMSYGHSYNSSYGMNGYSGHSIKDRMIACLEPMFDEAKSDYERQMISNTIARIRSEG